MKGSWKEKRTDKQKNKSKERDRKKKENSYVDGNLILPAIKVIGFYYETHSRGVRMNSWLSVHLYIDPYGFDQFLLESIF